MKNKKNYAINNILLMLLEASSVAFLLLLAAITIVLINSHTAQATTQFSEPLEAGEVRLLTPQGEMLGYAIRNQADVNISIQGMMATVSLKQSFTNQSDEWVEGVYVFPLPDKAAIEKMRLLIGDRIIEGEIQEKQQAIKNYTKAAAEGKQSSLLKQERPNLFTSYIANIAPGERISVEIVYQQLASYEQGLFELRFPMAVTPRYAAAKSSKVFMTQVDIADTDYAVNIAASLDTGLILDDVFSTSHEITQHEYSNGRRELTVDDPYEAGNRDFVLQWQVAKLDQPQLALFSEQKNQQNYHVLMIMPDVLNADLEYPSREVIFIIDTSGSMEGESMTQAKQALINGLKRLGDNDRFNVIEFNSYSHALYNKPKAADQRNIKQAIRWAKSLQAEGGTEMIPALELALNQGELQTDLRQLIFMTDGAISDEQALFELIETQLQQSRLFTIGIGAAPNAYFMRKVAQFGRGSYIYIDNEDDVQQQMNRLFSKLESPILTDIELHTDNGEPLEVYPQKIPDVYAGEPLIVNIRSQGQLPTLTLSGIYNQQPWQQQLGVTEGQSQQGIASFWARKKIDILLDEHRSFYAADDLKQQIIKLSLDFQVLSPFTAMVAIDKTPIRTQQEKLRRLSVPTALPAGRFPQTATGYQLQLLSGLLLLLSALGLLFWQKRSTLGVMK